MSNILEDLDPIFTLLDWLEDENEYEKWVVDTDWYPCDDEEEELD
jgi:hypothetical protein